jgi:hypothetical protein
MAPAAERGRLQGMTPTDAPQVLVLVGGCAGVRAASCLASWLHRCAQLTRCLDRDDRSGCASTR